MAVRYHPGFGVTGVGKGWVVRGVVWGSGLLRGGAWAAGFGGALQEAGGEAGVCLLAPSRVLSLNLLRFSLGDMDHQQIANNPKYLAVRMQAVALVCAAGGL